MDSVSIELLTQKLKNAPQSVLERVIGYIDALVESTATAKPYALSKEEQQILDSQLNSDKSTYVDAERLFDNLKSKHDL